MPAMVAMYEASKHFTGRGRNVLPRRVSNLICQARQMAFTIHLHAFANVQNTRRDAS